MSERQNLSRREFLRALGVAAGASLLAACSPSVTGPILPTNNSEAENSNETLIPESAFPTYLRQLEHNGESYGFYRIDQENNIQEGATKLLEMLATEAEKQAYQNNPMDWVNLSFVPEGQGVKTDFQMIEDPTNPNVLYSKVADRLCEHAGDGNDKDRNLNRTPDHSTLSWIILAGTIAAGIGIGSKLTQMGLDMNSNGTQSLVYTAEATLASVKEFLVQRGIADKYQWLEEIARDGMVYVRCVIPTAKSGLAPTIYLVGKTAKTILHETMTQPFEGKDRALIDTAKRILKKLLNDALESPKLKEVCEHDKDKLLDDLKKRLNKSTPVVEIDENNPIIGQACDILNMIGCDPKTPLVMDEFKNIFALINK